MSVGHSLHAQPDGCKELHNGFGFQNPSWLCLSVEFQLRTFQFCVLRAILLCQPPHIKNQKNEKNNISLCTLVKKLTYHIVKNYTSRFRKFLVLSNFSWFLHLVPNTLSRIADVYYSWEELVTMVANFKTVITSAVCKKEDYI